jgi:hypothetical protein
MATTECGNLATNSERCPCTYTSCSKRGRCCECLQSHLKANELPGCCFPPEVERTYDRSFARFVAVHSKT